MARCPGCDRELTSSDAQSCSFCGRALASVATAQAGGELAAPQPPRASASGEQQVASEQQTELELPRQSRPRLQSRSGPATPVIKQANDSVPSGNGWMARLEAAKKNGLAMSLPEVDAVEVAHEAPAEDGKDGAMSQANAKNGGLRASDSNGGLAPAKPTHLLIAELEAEEKRRAEAAAKRAQESIEHEGAAPSSISDVTVPLPTAAERKHFPKGKVMAAIAVFAVLAVGVAGYYAKREPPPPPAPVDPALQYAVENRKAAMAALEEGHRLLLIGKEKADEAIAAYTKALAREPTLAPAEKGLGSAYALKEDDANAVRHYKRYLELKPDASDAEQVRAIIERVEKKAAKPK